MSTRFGKAGTRTVRTYEPAVAIKFKEGEFLRFKLTVRGAEAIFAFACKHTERLSQASFSDHPTRIYQWDLGVDMEQEPDTTKKDTYALGMLFTAVAPGRYTLEVTHLSRDEQLVEQLIDVDYASTDPTDKYTEVLGVFAI